MLGRPQVPMISIYNTTAVSCAIGSDCWDTASRDHALISDDGAVGRCPSSIFHTPQEPTRSESYYGLLRLCVSPIIYFRTDVSGCQVYDGPPWCLAWPLAGGVSWVSGQHAGATATGGTVIQCPSLLNMLKDTYGHRCY